MNRAKNSVLDARGKKRVQTVNTDPSETVQSDAHLADINSILRSFGTGGMAMLDEADLMFKDVSEFTDLADALNQAKAAEIEFLKLPSKVREVFEHDVAVWLDTAHDKDKRDALVEAGLIKIPQESTKRRGRREGEAQASRETPIEEVASKDVEGSTGPSEKVS